MLSCFVSHSVPAGLHVKARKPKVSPRHVVWAQCPSVGIGRAEHSAAAPADTSLGKAAATGNRFLLLELFSECLLSQGPSFCILKYHFQQCFHVGRKGLGIRATTFSLFCRQETTSLKKINRQVC